MKRIPNRLLWLALTIVVVALPSTTEAGKDIPLSKVPKKVIEAAEKAVPGIKLTEAEVRKTSKGLVYEVEGLANGKKHEITVSAEGKVLRAKQELPDKPGEDDDGKDDEEDKD